MCFSFLFRQKDQGVHRSPCRRASGTPRSQTKPLSDLMLAVFSAPCRQFHAKAGLFLPLLLRRGRGWITQAAHLKKPRRGFFPPDCSAGRCCSNPPTLKTQTFCKQKTASISLCWRSFYGRGWIRTTEAEKQQIYSLSPLATREHAQIQFFSHR